jgi:hypothetical protein
VPWINQEEELWRQELAKLEQGSKTTATTTMLFKPPRLYGYGGCVKCTKGLDCPMSNEKPTQKAGYKVEIVDDSQREYSVFKCRNKRECIAGDLGSCAPGRQGIGCGRCKDNHYRLDNGHCAECGDDSILIVLSALAVISFLLLALHKFINQDPSRVSLRAATLALILGQVAAAMQSLAAFRQMELDWREPFSSLLNMLSVVVFDVQLIQIECIIGEDSPTKNYLFRLCAYPVIAFLLYLALLFPVARRQKVEWDFISNSQGLLLLVGYIALVLIVAEPFQCLKNPNGSFTLASNPSVICWESEMHTQLLMYGTIGLHVFPYAILSGVAYITMQLPSLIASGKGLAILKNFRWLFDRFAPEQHYWGMIYLIRGTLVVMVPVAFTGDAMKQVMVMGAVLLFYTALQIRFQPWRTEWANVSDTCIGMALIMSMMAAGFLVPMEEHHEVVVQLVLVGSFVSVIVVGALALLYFAYAQVKANQRYGVFLTHHKGGAAVLARYLKLKLKQICSDEIFLDADNLDNLDVLFDIVRCGTKALCAILTQETLSRMWCAGEITTAFVCKVPIVLLACDDYAVPDDGMLAQLDDVWTQKQKHTLSKMGISIDRIKETYRWLRRQDVHPFKRFSLDTSVQDASIMTIVEACKLRRKPGASFTVGQESGKRTQAFSVVILMNTRDAEAICIGHVLREMLQAHLRVLIGIVCSASESAVHVNSLEYLIVVLTKGAPLDTGFCEVLHSFCSVPDRFEGVEIVPVLAEANFDFSSLAVEDAEAEKSKPLNMAFQRILSVLALGFAPHASADFLHLQVHAIAKRLKKCGLETNSRRLRTSSIASMKSENSGFSSESGIPSHK